jgi:tRNA U34 5-methylaminomethyl-2-thiouridine-forming methyltransferase MnmC
MERELRITGDGSHTMFVPGLNEPYHSIHGAVRESMHVFIMYGLDTVRKPVIRILEAGLGTGLNVLLTLKSAALDGPAIYYHAVEKYPLDPSETSGINYPDILGGSYSELFQRIHSADWGRPVRIAEKFELYKERSDFREMDPQGTFDLVYFDAFDPGKQPYLWTEEVFSRIVERMNPSAVLVTYSARGSIRRALTACGLQVEKVPGPPGKKEMVRALKR